jgi:hypothetical protein
MIFGGKAKDKELNMRRRILRKRKIRSQWALLMI